MKSVEDTFCLMIQNLMMAKMKYCRGVKSNHCRYDPVLSANYLLMVLGVVLLIGVANNNGVICQGKINLQSIMFYIIFICCLESTFISKFVYIYSETSAMCV